MLTVTAATPAEQESALANLKPGDVLRIPCEAEHLYEVTSVETLPPVFDGTAETFVLVQARGRADRRARMRASYAGKGGFRFQIAGPTYCGLATMIPGFEIVA